MAAAQAASLAADLIASTATADRASGRRECTRILNQLKRGVLPGLSREDCLELLSAANGGGVDVDDGADGGDGRANITSALLSIANNTDDFPTEGHRETSVELLKGLICGAFGNGGDNAGGKVEAAEDERLRTNLMALLQQCSQTFQKRMSRCQTSCNGGFHHGTATEPVEPSEHIRLLLVELLLELGGHCSALQQDSGCKEEGESKDILEATSNICYTLAKSTLLDPCPEVQRAACDLVEVLARLCPLAVRMHATGLLAPLTGKVDETFGGAGEPSASSAAALSKKCLFRHRHSKTRCKAVDASASIVLCCQGEGSAGGSSEVTSSDDREGTQPDTAHHLSSYGSRSSSMEQTLLDSLLPAWEDLLKMDPSAPVQLAVLKCLGAVAKVLSWEHLSTPGNASELDLSFTAEARVLALLFTGMAAGNVSQVRSLAVQNLSSLQSGAASYPDEDGGNQLPRETLVAYYQPVLELILDACSQDWAPCQSKVRALESLQVLLSVATPLMEEGQAATVHFSISRVRSIVEVLSQNILSEEKDMLEAALAGCRILGSNGVASKAVVEIASTLVCGSTKSNAEKDKTESEDKLQQSSLAIDGSSPRQLASTLLILDGVMKGCLCNEDATSILQDVDPNLTISKANWFPSSAAAISAMLCNPAITSNVASNGSLAWALLDACGSFVKCSHQFSQGDGVEWKPSEEVTVNVLLSIAHLLGCPDKSGVQSNAMSILDDFSASQSCATGDESPSLMEVHFRGTLQRITASAPPFPWKQTDPSFLAMEALLRACSGFTIGSNFDLVAPFFISHLSTAAYSKSEAGGDSVNDQSLNDNGTAAKDKLAEEYSLRISLMALLQTILSDKSFSQTLCPGVTALTPTASTFSAQFTTDVLLSLVLPNLVWKAGGMAAALRKLAAATLFSLLSNYCDTAESGTGLLHPETTAHLLPILHSNLEDTESTTRELSCVCLAMVLEQVSAETFQTIWETNSRAIDTLHPRLLASLDDSHNPVRMAACKALVAFLRIANSTLGLSALDEITSTLLVQLDDPDEEIRDSVFDALSDMLQLYCEDQKVIQMMERHIITSLKSHRDGSYGRLLLEKAKDYQQEGEEKSDKA